MGTVSSPPTRIHDVEGVLTLTSIGGGAGGGANTEIFIQGAQAAGRKQSNVADHGFWLQVTSVNISGTGVHVGLWVNHIHYAVLTKLATRFGSTTANYHEHTIPLTLYPATGGWVRAWINVARTPEATAGTLDKTAVTQIAILASLPAVGGNAPNLILDAVDYTTAGLLLTGTAGVFQDFVSADEGSGTNKYGVALTRSGVIYCLARLTLGSSSSLAFNDSGAVLVFPHQSLVASDFMGLTCDLQNASTSIALADSVIRSPGTTKGDLVVTGTAGTLAFTAVTLAGLRLVTLTSPCVFQGCAFQACGLITAAGAEVSGCTISGSTATAALGWNVATDTDGNLDGTSFAMGAGEHGIVFGSNTPSEITLRNVTFAGYGSDGTASAAILNDAGKAVTINIVGGTIPTVKNGSGASTTLVANPVIVTITTRDAVSAALVPNARVLLTAATGGPLPYQESVTITRSGTTATVSHTGHGVADGKKVLIVGADQPAYNGVRTITVIGADSYSYTVSGEPATPATGSITATAVILEGTTSDPGGTISDTRPYSSNQPVEGRARRATTGTLYKTGGLLGTVLSASGLALTALLIPDV